MAEDYSVPPFSECAGKPLAGDSLTTEALGKAIDTLKWHQLSGHIWLFSCRHAQHTVV
jgi:hypothetical protein